MSYIMRCIKYLTLKVVKEVAMFTFANTKDKRIREYGEACFVQGAMWAKGEMEELLCREQKVNNITKDLNQN